MRLTRFFASALLGAILLGSQPFSAAAQSPEFFKPRTVMFNSIPWHADRLLQGLRTQKSAPELLYLTLRSEHEVTEFVTLTSLVSEFEAPVYEYLGFAELEDDGLPSDASIRRWTEEIRALESRLETQTLYVLVPVRGKPEYQAYRLGPHQKLAKGFSNFGSLLRRAFKSEGINVERALPQASLVHPKSTLKNAQHFLYRGMRGAQPIIELEMPEDILEESFLDEFNLVKKQAVTTGFILQIRYNETFTSETVIQADSLKLLEKIVVGCNQAFTRRQG
jgi:hypothetical protein